jgi:thioredoxin 1
MNKKDNCPLINNANDLNAVLKANDKALVLFYASWCPYSARFLPVFQNCEKKAGVKYVRILIDDNEDVEEEYSIEVVPTVIYFEKGKVSQRLDGIAGDGLNPGKLKAFSRACNL